MKSQYLDKLLSSPWNIDKLRGRTLLSHIAGLLVRSDRPAEDVFGDPLPKMQVVGDVAVIPIRGLVSMVVPDWIKEYGLNLTDANDIVEEIDQAVADPNVAVIVLDVDSPGGLSIAGDKMFDAVEIAQKKKPVFGWVADGCDACSTSYEAIASCQAILAGPYAAAVGCVGSYIAYLDDSKYWANLGIESRVFRSGELKGLGEDGLSEAQAAYLQSLADSAGAAFRARVKKYRTGIEDADMEGQWFSGSEAARRGFTHGTAKDMSAALVKFRRMIE